ncbi:MAG: type II toxin-antitoxin system HicB family antitoxin [Nitrospiria bacterium]
MALFEITLNLDLNPGPDRVYTVTSPDVPGLITEGSTLEEIAHNVQEAIEGLLMALEELGKAPPQALQRMVDETKIEIPMLVMA